MFTGIIEETGVVEAIETNGTNITFTIRANLAPELKPDQSVGHSGVCLTVESVTDRTYRVTAIEETLKKTNLRFWQAGTVINLERCLRFDGRLDGHIVQGHVDSIAECIEKKPQQGSWEFTFSFDSKFASLLIEKGSVSVNGISLTVFNVTDSTFTVAIIPYTFEHTNIQYINAGDKVNIEFDMIGKYVNRMNKLKLRYYDQ